MALKADLRSLATKVVALYWCGRDDDAECLQEAVRHLAVGRLARRSDDGRNRFGRRFAFFPVAGNGG